MKATLPQGSPRLTILQQMAARGEKLAARGERLRQLRKRKRVSQETAAHHIGVTARAYSEWEAGRGGMKWTNIESAAEYYGTTADFIEYGVPERETPDLSRERELETRISHMEDQLQRITGMLEDALRRLEGEGPGRPRSRPLPPGGRLPAA